MELVPISIAAKTQSVKEFAIEELLEKLRTLTITLWD
jgi:hypothetical protein